MLRQLGAEIQEYKKKGKVKAQRVALALLIGLQVSPPFIGAGMTSAYLLWPDKKITITESDTQYRFPKEFSALDYMNAANSIAHQESRDDYDLCKEYTTSTYDAYRKLVAFNHRSDLEEKVRVVTSFIEKPHVWLQVKDGATWIDYDVASITPPQNMNLIKKYSQRFRKSPRPMEDNYAIEGATPQEVPIIGKYLPKIVFPKAWTFFNPTNIAFWQRLKSDPADERPQVVHASNQNPSYKTVSNLYK